MAAKERQAVKVPIEALEQLRKLAAYTARNGWASLGIDREDPPTQTALIEEAIRLLVERSKQMKKRKGRR